MKINSNTKGKEFDTVQTFRDIKEKISADLVKMDFEQIKKYLKANSKKLQTQ